MKKIFLIAAVTGIMTFSAEAQVMPERKNDGVRTERRGDVYKDLNLTADQQQKLNVLNKDGRSQMEAIRNDNSLTQEQRKAKFDALRQSQKAKRDAILTADQRAKMDAKAQEMRKNRRGGDWKADGKKDGVKKGNMQGKDRNGLSKRGDHRRGGNPGADLNLSEQQKNQMKSLSEDGRSKMQAIRDNASLTDEQKKAQMMELRKTQNEKRMAILTPEQKKKWDENRKEMRGRSGKRI